MTFDRSALTTLVCFGILASGGIAAAQDATDPGEAGGPPEGAPADGATPPPDGATPPADGAAAPAARWPRAVIARPLTLPAGLAQVGADFGANNDFSVLGLNVAGGYGITDDFEVNGFYAFALKEFEIKGNLDIDLGYKLLRGAAGGKLEVIGRARLGYNIALEGLNPLRLGAHVQYSLTDKIALITPGQQLVFSLEETPIGMATGRPMFFQLPVAVGFQATPELYLQLDTTLAQIEIADSGNAFFGADTTPLAVTGLYNAVPEIDVFATIGVNLTPPATVDVPDPGVGDSLTFLVGFRYFAGAL
jgi:hypothetical protein